MASRRHSSSWLLASVALGAALACLTEGTDDTAKKRAPLDVPLSWQTARQSKGHAVHVAEEQIACEQCHALGADKFQDPGPAPCARCHVVESRITHAEEQARAEFGASARADCTACHSFATGAQATVDASAESGPWDCERCHTQAAAAHPPATAAHRGAPCEACHTPHGDGVAQPADCAGCHAAVHLSHGQAGQHAGAAHGAGAPHTSSQACRVCHQRMHDPAAAAVDDCQECHSTAQVPAAVRVAETALLPRGHERCIDCHEAHDFSRGGAVPCQSCHDNPPALAARNVPAHAECTSCHQAHDARATAASSCESCHAKLKNDHPPAPGKGDCVSCHVAHPRGAGHASKNDAALATCTSCHREADHDGGFHGKGVGCTACHAPHQFDLQASGLALCSRCHASEVHGTARLGAGHGDCTACHSGLPHDTSVEPRACRSCHADEAHAAARGHQDCRGCHDPHSGGLQQDCAACHRSEHASAPAAHRACVQCHEPHGGKPDVQPCTSCHAKQARAPHHDLQGGCTTCHSAHGPKAKSPPACISCHERAKWSDLHAVAQHGQCSDCHQAHSKRPAPEPPTCRSCHRDKQQHFPETQRCSGCHLFKQR